MGDCPKHFAFLAFIKKGIEQTSIWQEVSDPAVSADRLLELLNDDENGHRRRPAAVTIQIQTMKIPRRVHPKASGLVQEEAQNR